LTSTLTFVNIIIYAGQARKGTERIDRARKLFGLMKPINYFAHATGDNP